MDIKELQNEILKIAIDFDKFCQENGIQYFLMGGSALGAVRHQGFIPWDDDFDVFMTSENYVNFLQIAKDKLSEEYYLEHEATKEWPLYFTKIKKNGTRFIEDWTSSKVKHKGIFMDVFPLNNQSDNKIIANLQYISAKILIAKTLSKSGYKTKSIKKKTVMFLIRILAFWKLEKIFLAIVRSQNKKKTKNIAHYFGKAPKSKLAYPAEFFNEVKLLKFENVNFPVVKEVEKYLTIRFGDYMKLPSSEEIEKAKHSSKCEFYIDKK